jgi:tetratricopeptide (TPR) repeat protein
MRSRFSETGPLLDTALALGKSLSTNQGAISMLSPGLREEFEHLQRIYYHHSGSLGEHTNDNEASISNFKKFTEMLQEKFGDAPRGDDKSLGVAWNELGNSYLQYHLLQEAEECHLKSIEALRVLDGATKIDINMPLINLAYTYWVGGQLERAAKTFEEALEDRIRECGENDRTSFV